MNSEKAVENFYNWELKGRGYSLFSYPVDIEPTYREFYHSFSSNRYIDDGKVPTLLERLFSNKRRIEEVDFIEEEPPNVYEYTPFLKQIKISFSSKQKFDESLFLEFINMLSESINQISFEIIGKHNTIEIQIICSLEDFKRTLHLLRTYFPESIITPTNFTKLPFDNNENIVIVDFGYDEEFLRPINTLVDGLTGIMAVFENLGIEDVTMFQIIFKGVKNAWVNSILNSVKIGSNSFFPDSPEMVSCAKEKVSSPLFAVIIRMAVKSKSLKESENLANELMKNIKIASRSEFNSLIPLSNSGYSYKSHLGNLKLRGTDRFGMIMNSKEIFSFVHFPNSTRILNNDSKTKIVPESFTIGEYLIGINRHFGVEKKVFLNDVQRLRHCHIIGATGTGKSTLISNLFLEDVKYGNGCVIFDPHGDTIEEIISHIPENRIKDVILIDPSDKEFSFGFNLLSANTEVEKIVLSSDLVEAFRRHSTSWGDQMTSVLANAINTFLNSNRGGTLIELKRFLLESAFRKEFLKSVDDRNIHYYWDNEFVLLKKVSISPLLTRLDTFLRPKTIRNILSQKEGLDFNDVLKEKKILLVKLSQGLIGEENSYLLGTLILSKIYQVALARQSISKEERLPFYIYLDEFQNFITPSINGILSGARKYGMGLILAHQELNQIKDTDISNSLLSNANIRICFRLGDMDAKRLESGFSYFDSNDLQNLNIGEAIVRIGKKTDDFSLNTLPLKQVSGNMNEWGIIENTRNKYSKRISEIEEEMNSILLDFVEKKFAKKEDISKEEVQVQELESDIEEKGHEYLETFKEKEELREHRYLQTFIKKIAEQRGFKSSIEEIVENGRIDVALVKDSIKIACEIAVSNSVEYEIKNINKCLGAGYSFVCIVSRDEEHLRKIEDRIRTEISDVGKIYVFDPNQMIEFLDSFKENNGKEVQRIKGYRVRVNYKV